MASNYSGGEDEQRALDAYIKLMRAANSVSSSLQPYLTAKGLSPTQLGVLEALLHLGPLCLSDLSRKLLKSSGNITTVVDNLEKRGLVRRERMEKDRRFVQLHLSNEGRGLIEGVFPGHAAQIQKKMGSLSEEELAQLGELCRKLGLAVAGHGDDADS